MTDINLLGRTLGPFEIISELGRGGMAVVYKARQADLERTVALKILPPELSIDKSYLARFLQEARVLGQLAQTMRVEQDGLFAVSRLDVGVSGVLLVTLGARSRERLLAERAAGRLRRRYLALSAGVPEPAEGDWRDALGAAGGGRRAVDGRDAQKAHSQYRVVATAKPTSRDSTGTALLALSPITGRTHQLRVQASAHGAPILGDRKYAGPPRMTASDGSVHAFSQILLHAAWVEWGFEAERRRVTSEPVAALHRRPERRRSQRVARSDS